MQFDQFLKRLLEAPDILRALLAAADPQLLEVLDIEQARPITAIPTFRLKILVPDKLWQVPFSEQGLALYPFPTRPNSRPEAALAVEAKSHARPETLDQVASYLALYQLARAEKKRGWSPFFFILFLQSATESSLWHTVASWPKALAGPWSLANYPQVFVVQSADRQARERAERESAMLAVAMELHQVVGRGQEAVLGVLRRRCEDVMEAFSRYRASGKGQTTLVLETMLQFLMGLPAGSEEEARGWERRLMGWWRDCAVQCGVDMEDVMEEYISAAELLRREGREQGLKQGLQKGLKQGLREGLQKGQVEQARQMVLDAVEERFGEVSEEVRERVFGIEDPEELRALLRKALRVDRPEELLA